MYTKQNPADDECDAQDDLENSLTHIDSVAEVLIQMSEIGAAVYLGGLLKEHYREAHDAFCRIFKLGEYRAEKSSEREGGAA